MRRVLLSLLLTLAPFSARACDLALVLAIDVSGSVDPRDYEIQMRGMAEALRDPIVSEAVVRAEAALLLLQWTGSTRQQVSIPWRQIRSFEDVERLAADIEAVPRQWRNFATAIGEALEVSLAQFEDAPACDRHVIDVSGDGMSNEGPEPRSLHDRLGAAGVTVNALAIESNEEDLTAYFWENVILGEGAFVVTAADYRDYPERIRQKLRREVEEQVAGAKSLDPAEPAGLNLGP